MSVRCFFRARQQQIMKTLLQKEAAGMPEANFASHT